ncbi:MAG: TIGR02300 family protein [Rhodospirillaceae bacterium]|nr:TIGR02300 family protein [Rhodospirillaceae bacterium]
MAKPEWGLKRTCQSCNVRFYDLGRTQITCPKCGAVYDAEAVLKTRRGRPIAAEKPEPVKPKKVEPEVVDGEIEVVEGEDEDEAVLEDASELGEDEDLGHGVERREGDKEV